ncbi:MBL fold metallo-hydrolase [Hypericibacter sp.]|uniref:MBL fold metallo-hydrolase n=1 Tax=Hypericibacter sp. TaxID=2705401 RepID=UPI003D6CA4D6
MTRPVAEFWYGVEAHDHGIVRLRETAIDPYLAGNMWLVRGSRRDLLIDTGTGIVSARPILENLSGKPLLAVACVGFYDHAGGLHHFAERGCHPAEADRIARPTLESSAVADYVSEGFVAFLPYEGFETAAYRMQGTTPTVQLGDGDVIDLGDRQLEVLHMPGMTPGSIALWEAATGSLFSCDTLYDDPVITRAFEPPDRPAYLESVKRLKTLPVVTVYAGHFATFGRARMMEIIDRRLGSHAA